MSGGIVMMPSIVNRVVSPKGACAAFASLLERSLYES
jgi:hypothetical protein